MNLIGYLVVGAAAVMMCVGAVYLLEKPDPLYAAMSGVGLSGVMASLPHPAGTGRPAGNRRMHRPSP